MRTGLGRAGGLNFLSASSKWLKEALRSALDRDPVDVLNDALKLAALYQAIVTVLFEERDVH
jgi:hypothetical protein